MIAFPNLRAPEIAGLAVLGGTIGALLCGAGTAAFSDLMVYGAVGGAMLPVVTFAAARNLSAGKRLGTPRGE